MASWPEQSRLKLNQWQQIGVLLSVAWAIGAYLTVTKLDYDKAAEQVAVTHRLCTELKVSRNESDFASCAQEEQKTWDNWTRLTIVEAIALAIIPIPFGWVFGDFVAWVIQRKSSRSV